MIAMPLAASAQTATTVRRIGVLDAGTQHTEAELQEEYAPLRAVGWVVGQNLLVERRYANGKAELLRPLAEELVRLKVEIIVTRGTDATLAAKNATTTIPIVIQSSGDPVRTGLVASLPRPGGNITGFSIVGPEIDAKRLALLRELLPGLQRVGVLDIRPIRIIAPCAKSWSRRAGHLACSRSSSKSPRQTSWKMRSRRWLAGERRRYL